MIDLREIDIIRLEAEAFVTDVVEEITSAMLGRRSAYADQELPVQQPAQQRSVEEGINAP